MESIGEKLRSVRESKRLTIKEVSKDTNIAAMYIEALENEDFDSFPGETYVIGFIRSYSEYLKVDADDIIRAYKGYKIGESVTPLEELTKPTTSFSLGSFDFTTLLANYKKYIIIGIVAVLLAVVAVLYLKNKSVDIDVSNDDSISKIKDNYNKETQSKEFEKIQSIQMSGNKGYAVAYKNEAVQFLADTKELVFVLKEIAATSIQIQLMPDKKIQSLEIDKPIEVKFAESPTPVTMILKSTTENRARILVEVKGGSEKNETTEQAANTAVTEQKSSNVDTTKVQATSEKSLKIVFEAEFTAKTYIELYLDGQQKTRGVVAAGAIERWEANEYIQIKIGNAGGVKAKINGKEYTFGMPGQVANKVITWNKDPNDPNTYVIVVKDW